ncbi:MAG: pantoate--beta-alanine ligase [Candidatus Omnitrophica bacterium]|nr:pantoate--beta-alanine ligase [Candidatus Omnitrophota bacterium]
MKIIRSPKILNALLTRRERKIKVGFVPTMGALHAGHLSLIERARKENDFLVVSIFVNPAQFGPREDLDKYPRPIKNDLALCRKAGVDIVFFPEPRLMYPEGFTTYVTVEKLSDLLCGASRPGHFRGVATVVSKFLNIVSPDTLYLGQKDAQQAIILKRMVSDLNFPVKVKVMPTVRSENGLAVSSRNAYLNSREIELAGVLWEALNRAGELIRGGNMDYQKIISEARKIIAARKGITVDYFSIVNLDNLSRADNKNRRVLVALAVRINKTRLIDNLIVCRR